MGKPEAKPAGQSKNELIRSLSEAKSSKDKNKAVKLLRKFKAVRRIDLDAERDRDSFNVRQLKHADAFFCYRCDSPKQSLVKVRWTTSKGIKMVCVTCFNYLQGEGPTSVLDDSGIDRKLIAEHAERRHRG